jgi:hypothetical protein
MRKKPYYLRITEERALSSWLVNIVASWSCYLATWGLLTGGDKSSKPTSMNQSMSTVTFFPQGVDLWEVPESAKASRYSA